MQNHLSYANIKSINIFVVISILALLFYAPLINAQGEKLEDDDITLAIDREFILDEAIEANMIDIETREGIVTLSGVVNNLLAKERALNIAESIKGVRSVVNNIAVKPVVVDDSQIEENVELALFNDPAADSWEINVLVEDGVVTLTGTVESWAEKRLAEDVAKTVKGIVKIQNNLSIDYKTDRNDFEIRKDIVHQLKSSVWIDDGLIRVHVKDGRVKLSGAVGSAAEKRRVTGRAWVSGVESVDNSELKVEWWARDSMQREEKYQTRSDEEIRKAIEEAFLYDPRVYAFAPHIDMNNGVVTLTGTVENLRAKKAAAQDARNTIGVVYVKNHLKVRPQKIYSDQQISDQVKKAIEMDPMLDRLKITVTTVNGKVYLNGRVHSEYEKRHAENITSRQWGVIEVENNLIVEQEWERKSDAKIEEDVENELFWSPFVNSENIQVEVENANVILRGTVNTRYQAQLAVENAYEGGANRVLNNLTVKYDYGFPDIGKSTDWPYRGQWYSY
jgi:osmotically-inducible protein OsmY